MKKKTLKNKADKLWREAVWKRDKYQCQVCGKEARNAHHIVGRRNFRLRWEIDNGITLCPYHHTFSSTFSAHQTPTIFAEWFRDMFPDRHHFLMNRVNEIWDKNYDRVIKELEGFDED